ncbi:MAG: nucleoside-diphosphate kinase [bacterium JZ-2024 1]
MVERTLVLVKPDGVRRGLIGEVIARIERKGYRVVALKMLRMDRALAERHYETHSGKPFFESLVTFITSGALVAMVVEGEGALAGIRRIMGATDPQKAEPGTLRGDFATCITENLVHGSDSVESAAREISLFFGPSEIMV